MSAEEILQTAQRRLIVAEKEIREKAKAAEAMYVNSSINHDPYGTDKWRAVAFQGNKNETEMKNLDNFDIATLITLIIVIVLTVLTLKNYKNPETDDDGIGHIATEDCLRVLDNHKE